MKKSTYFLSLFLMALFCLGSNHAWGEDLTLTVMDNDWTTQNVPVDGYNLDGAQHNQLLFLSTELSAMNGSAIKGLKFYFNRTGHAWKNASNIPNVTFRLAEVSNTSLTSQITVDGSFTQVYSGTINFDFSNKLFTVTFDTPYSYNGGNLLIDIQTTAGSSYVTNSGNNKMKFYGDYISGRAMKGSLSETYCPKTTFTYEEAQTGSCAKPKTLVASSILPDGATFTWAQGGEETEYQYACVAQGATPESWTDVEGTERTLTLHGLTAGTAYDLYVRSNCDAEQSVGAKVSFTPTCPAPTAPVVSGISATSATLSWTAASGITDYQYIVVANGAAQNWTSPTSVEGATSANLTGLNPSTNYDVYVRSYYSATTQSTAVKASFQTACGAVTIPFTWDFSSIGCWTTKQCHASSGISSGAFSFHYISSAPYDQYLISPEFDALSGTVDVQFDYRVYSATYSETFALGYSKTTSDIASFTWLSDETVNNTSYGDPYKKTLPAGVKYIAIRCTSEDKYALYIDNFSIEETPACPAPTITASNVIYNAATINCAGGSTENKWRLQYKAAGEAEWTDANGGALIAAASFDLTGLTPGTAYQAQAQAECAGAWSTAVAFTPAYIAPTDLTVTATTTTSATLSWTANSGETAWTVQYKKSGDADWTTVENVTVNPYTLTGLTSGSSYQVRVAAGSLYTAALNFNTDCDAKAIPFEEHFDALNCWSMQNQVSNTGLYNHMFCFSYGYADQHLISPELVASENQVQVEFEYYVYLGTETFHVGYSTTTNEVSAFTWGDEIAATNTSALTYSEKFPANVKYIAIKYTSYDKYYLYIDNFSVTEYVAPSCEAPTALTVNDVTTNSASVSWTSEAANFALEYKKTSDENWTAATGTIASPFALEGLTANETEYTVRVKAICGENNESEWGELAAPFKTECTVKTVTEETAWTEDFEALTADQAPACFGEVSSYAMSAYTRVNASAAKDGSLGMQIYVYGTNTEIALLPVFTEEAKNLKLSFDYKNQGTGTYYAALEVGYYTGSSFMNVVTLDKTDVFAASGEIQMPNDAPAGARIAFRVAGKKSGYNGSAYIDNLSVIRKPACAVPTALAAVATSTGVTLTWTAGDESQWNIRYREIAEPENVWTLVENVATGYAITDLLVDHNYEVQVQAYCDATHQSAWTASTNFTPVCGAVPTALTVSARSTNAATLTWEGTESAFKLQTSLDGETWSDAVVVNAKTYELSGLTAGTTYYVRVQNACGGDYATTSFTTWCGLQEAASLPLNITSFTAIPECWEINFVGEYSSIANNVIYFYGNAEQMAVLPAYDIELNKLSVTFGYSTNNANLEFGYLDEPNGTFHAFASQPASGVELNLENEAAAAKYIAVRYTATSAYASGSISSVLLRKTPTCAKPTDLTATPAVGAASIDWTSEATAWNLQYKLASAADWTDAAVTAKPFEITSLAQGASYKVRVQANCGDELSDWSDEISFTTSCSGIDAIPYYADFSAELSSCWGVFAQNESYYKPTVNTAMQQLTMNGGKDGASNNVVVMPPFSADLSNAVINFEYSCSTGANYAQLEVGYVTDKADASTFVALGEPLAQSGSWTETRVATATVPADAYIAFRYAGASSHGDLAIRNLRVIKDATLVDSENNEEALGALIGETVDVTINRTLTEGYYNTLCLPFDLETLDNTPLEGSELWGFKYGYVENGELLIRIVEAQQIVAGVPYLIIVPSTVVTPTFKDVVIRENIGKSVGETEEVKFVGILKPEAFSTSGDDVHKKLFLLPDNQLAWAGVANNLKSFRAYFRTTENVSGQPVAGIPARILREPSIATGCENVQDAVMSIKVLENNQVVIIRNGVKYNLQGQIIEKF